eukprot:6410660-Prymnesium_polylepis.1
MAEKIATLGTAACPPYHLAVVIGGLSAEMTLKTVKVRPPPRPPEPPSPRPPPGPALSTRKLSP